MRTFNTRQQIPKPQGYLTTFRAILETEWSLTQNTIATLRKYFLKSWHTTNVVALIKDGQLDYEGIKYQVSWLNGKYDATRGKYVMLSFRATYGKDVLPIVLIKRRIG